MRAPLLDRRAENSEPKRRLSCWLQIAADSDVSTEATLAAKLWIPKRLASKAFGCTLRVHNLRSNRQIARY